MDANAFYMLPASLFQVIQDLPSQTAAAPPGTLLRADFNTRRSQHNTSRPQQTHRALAAKTPKTSRVQISSHHGTPRRHHVASPTAAGSSQPSIEVTDSSASQAGCGSTPGTCKTTQGFFLDFANSSSVQSDQPQQQPQQVPADILQQLQPPDYASVPFKLQHLRLEVMSPDSSPRSRCSKGPKTARSPGPPQSAAAPPGSNLAGKHDSSPSFHHT
jgi:hypothetical protein